jgi:hypothetical protein
MRFDKWQNSLGIPYNSIIQVVQNRVTTQNTTTSQTEVIGNQVTITPKFATSKILVWAYSPVRSWGAVINPWMGVSLYRNEIRILHDGRAPGNNYSAGIGVHISNATGTTYAGSHSNMMILDSPATTSAITYSARFSSINTSTSASYPHTESNNSSDAGAVIIVMEIAQ